MTVVQSCPILCDPWTVARQASPTMELSGEHMLLGSHHNNDLEQRTLKPLVRPSSQVLYKPCHSS